MALTNPKLPPVPGYVEVIDENGNHVYKPTQETIQRMQKEEDQKATNQDLIETLANLLGSSEDRKYQAAEQFRAAVQLFATTLTDEQAMSVATIYPEWTVGKAYSVGDIFSWGTNSVGDPQLYKVVQAHTSQADWTPESTPSLYDAFGLDESGHTIWARPSGAHDAYNIGDIVNYNGTLYKSVINGNVWSPDEYAAGWEVYEEAETPSPSPDPEPEPEEPVTPPETDTVPEFVQPSGAHDAYNIGDRVSYNGKVYESVINSNVWSPDAYPQGWKVIEA